MDTVDPCIPERTMYLNQSPKKRMMSFWLFCYFCWHTPAILRHCTPKLFVKNFLIVMSLGIYKFKHTCDGCCRTISEQAGNAAGQITDSWWVVKRTLERQINPTVTSSMAALNSPFFARVLRASRACKGRLARLVLSTDRTRLRKAPLFHVLQSSPLWGSSHSSNQSLTVMAVTACIRR